MDNWLVAAAKAEMVENKVSRSLLTDIVDYATALINGVEVEEQQEPEEALRWIARFGIDAVLSAARACLQILNMVREDTY